MASNNLSPCDSTAMQDLNVGNKPKRWVFSILELCKNLQPLDWLIDGWLQAEAMMMMFGAPGLGKSFLALDMALSIASPTIRDWHGLAIQHGPVFYAAGEGGNGVKIRSTGWLAHHSLKNGPCGMYLGDEARDLNTKEGLDDVIGQIEAYRIRPRLIVIDTLNRFLAGDENSSLDVKGMLDSCGVLQRMYNAAILIIHHCGVSPSTQDRLRGSSAWKGAMDVEMRVKNEGGSALLECTKIKDGVAPQPLRFDFHTVPVPGCFDRQERQVTTAVLQGAGE